MRILVTGGAGFVGSHVAEGLLAAGHEVVVLGVAREEGHNRCPDGARFIQGSVTDRDGIERAFAEVKPDVVSHHAAVANVTKSVRDPLLDAEVNVMGSLVVLQACLRHGVSRLVFASTGGAIYGEVPAPRAAVVGDPTLPLSPYACSKLAVEHYIHMYGVAHGLHATILRYANVYGPRQDPHGEAGVVAIFSRKLLAGDRCRINARREAGDDGCIRDYVSVRDVVAANLLAIADTLGDTTINICTGEPTTTLQVARGLMTALDLDAPLDYGPWRAGDLERSVLDATEMRARVGTPLPLGEGLRQTALWFREHP